MLGLLSGPKQAAQPGAGAKPGRTRGCTYLRYGAPQFGGEPQFSREPEMSPTFPFSQASKPKQDRSSELLRQLSGVIS